MARAIKFRIIPGLLVVILLGMASWLLAARSVAAFEAPSTITLVMHQLYPSGAIKEDALCSSGNQNWGCTAYCIDYPDGPCITPPGAPNPYPYPWTQATVTLQIEGADPASGYLLNVVPRESGPDAIHPTAVQAQAMAARTYAYWHIVQQTKGITSGPIDNSSDKQVFVPYWYNAYPAVYGSKLGGDFQAVVLNAIADRFYLSSSTSYWYAGQLFTVDDPIFSEFFADRPLQTVANPAFTYQIAVADPISSHPAVPYDGHGRGMSQHGASRWARGNLSFNTNQDYDAWSVNWLTPFQILTHYYTGIHVRNAASSGNPILTPQRRFAVINASVNNRPLGAVTAQVCAHQVNALTVVLQNTGTVDWYASDTGLGYCWGDTCAKWGLLPQSVAPGATVALTLPIQPGAGRLSVDLYYQNGWWPYAYQWFNAGVSGDLPWLRQSLDPLLMQCRQRLPAINNDRWQPQS